MFPANAERTVAILLFLAVVTLFWTLLNSVIYETRDGIYTGFANNLGDLPFHLGVINRFALGGNVPPEDPTYAGIRFTYPFLVDFVAAMFVRVGTGVREALLIENGVLGVSLAGLLYYWTLEVTADRRAALVALLLIGFSGGMGWWLFVQDVAKNPQGIVAMLGHLPHDYTILPGHEWRWGNVITTLLVPQRSLLFGLPLVVMVMTLWLRAIRHAGSHATKKMAAAGTVAGLLPLIHAHSFIVVMGLGGCLALLFASRRLWVVFFAAALVLSLPQLAWSVSASSVTASNFLGWQFGWDKGDHNVLWFWLRNTGVLIPLAAAGLFWHQFYGLSRSFVRYYLPLAALCFVIPNVVRLAPWIWDNVKVLIYWYVATVPVAALLLVRLWQRNWWWRSASMALIGSLTLAGGLDLWRVVSGASEVLVFNGNDVAFASLVRDTTPPGALVLHAPTYNHPVFLTGRRSVMGYPGHLWSRGIDSRSREADIRAIYAGDEGAPALLAQYRVDYVVVGPLERRLMRVNEMAFKRYTLVGDTGLYHLYRISPSVQ
jgi:hypothetical protein